jgi:flagellar M-ring protein FliF
MDNFDTIVEIAEWLAMPITYLFLAFLFLLFVVRPFFAYLFSHDRIKNEKTIEEAKRKMDEIDQTLDGDDTVPFDSDFSRGNLSDADKMGKLAQSDPEKAGDLVKEWLKKDK